MLRCPPTSTLFPYTTLFRSYGLAATITVDIPGMEPEQAQELANEIGRHTSELQSRRDLVCRLLLEKKNNALLRPKTVPTIAQHRLVARLASCVRALKSKWR